MKGRAALFAAAAMVSLVACQRPLIKPFGLPETGPVRIWGGNAERQGISGDELTPPLEPLWTSKGKSSPGKAIVAVDGYIISGDRSGFLNILDLRTGKTLRSVKVDKRIDVTCAVSKNGLILAKRWGKDTIIKVDLRSGKAVWEMDAGAVEGEPLITGDTLLVGNESGEVFAVEASTGRLFWQRSLGASLRGSIARSGDCVILATAEGAVWSLSSSDGSAKWKQALDKELMAAPVIYGSMLFVGTRQGDFLALSREDGRTLWSFDAEGGVYESASVSGDSVYFGTSRGWIYALDAFSGKMLWRLDTGNVVGTSPLISGQYLYFGSLDKNLYAVARRTGEIVWKHELRGRVRTTPIIHDSRLIVGSENRYVYAFAEKNH